jgi:serine/threonine-protein kinase
MGEVYRATDTNLSRQVAIKVLPEAVAADPDRLARFDREARTLAALNHPNIAAIYGLERSGGITALVMELVEGPTLADRIAQGALPLDEALPSAVQIAKALESAHEQGIIHRDLKPTNIKVRADGTVKVLDFGLAKALAPDAPASAISVASLSPTITSPAMMTGAGIILGTAAYMSPEQARGKAVDKRADIWAFGVVVFEMLSGQRAFTGEDVSDILADVMRVEPAWTKLPGHVPPALLTFLKQCLRKNPAERIRDIGDVRLALEGAFDTIVRPAPGSETALAQPLPRPLWRRVLPIGAALLVAATAAVAGWLMKPAVAQQVVRAVHSLPAGRTFRGAGRPVLAMSPDSRSLVYNGIGGLYIRDLDAFSDRLIPGTEANVLGPVFSPDGSSLAFYQDGYIRRIALTGGASTPIIQAPGFFGLSWNADGSILYATNDGVWQVSESGGEPIQVLKSGESETYGLPQRLPGGEWLLLSAFRADQFPQGSTVAILPATGERRVLREGVIAGRYVESGHLLYFEGGVLYAVPFDAKSATPQGGPVAVVEGVRSVVGVPIPQAAVSQSGTLAFLPGPIGTSTNRFTLATADRTGAMMPLAVAVGPYAHVRATRDGARVAVDSDDGKEAFVSIYDMAGTSAMRRLTFEGKNRFPIWSPDSLRVAFQSDRNGDGAIYVQNANGTAGTVERLTEPEKGTVHIPESWSRDGRSLSFSVLKGSLFSLAIYSFDSRKWTPFGDVRSVEPTGSVFSPDGKWIAYHVRLENAPQTAPSGGVFVEPFPQQPGVRFQAPRVNFDFQPVWSHDGAELLYIPSTASGRMAAVRFMTTPAVGFGSPTTFPFSLTAGRLSGHRRAFDVLPSGQFVSLSAEGETLPFGGPSEIRLVVNWFDELRRLAPPR